MTKHLARYDAGTIEQIECEHTFGNLLSVKEPYPSTGGPLVHKQNLPDWETFNTRLEAHKSLVRHAKDRLEKASKELTAAEKYCQAVMKLKP